MSYSRWKRWCDKLFAALILTASLPLWGIAAVLLLLSQGLPLIFRQTRVGLHGKPFELLKFRTMTAGSAISQADRPVAKYPNDPRITPLGHFMRRFAIDEIPQLINVFRGEMSIVGPRPLPLEDLEERGWLEGISEVERERRLQWQNKRHEVLPGLTGSWQITQNPAADFENWIISDLDYVEHLSPVRDFLIVMMTPVAVIRGRRKIRS